MLIVASLADNLDDKNDIMIAASDPQEYVPSGRRQAQRHPGPLEPFSKKLDTSDDFLLDKFEKVTLKEQETEWWTLRKAPIDNANVQELSSDDDCDREFIKSYVSNTNSEFMDESLSFKSAIDVSHQKVTKRVSDVNVSRLSSKRLSNDSNSRNVTNKSLHEIPINPQTHLFKTKLDSFFLEDELYVKNNTVIWSTGLVNNFDNIDNGRKTICCHTSPLPIKHALWCKFYCERPNYDTNLFEVNHNENEPNGTSISSVCIFDKHNIRVFTPKGEDFAISVPFEIATVWSTKFGVFIEKKIDDEMRPSYDNKCKLYSLAYPLDEICPVVIQNQLSHNLQLLNTNNIKLVFTSESPSVCMVFDSYLNRHSIYRIRKIRSNEQMEFVEKMDMTSSTTTTTTNQSNRLKNRLSMWESLKNCQNFLNPSPMNSRPNSVAGNVSLLPQQSKSQSSMATISRCQSPAVSSTSPWLIQQSRLNNTNQSLNKRSFFDYSKVMSHLHSTPKICMEYLWCDHFTQIDENTSNCASKVFISKDFTGYSNLYYVIPNISEVIMVRIDYTKTKITFSYVTNLSGKDAVPIPHLGIMALLENSGNITLYSGLTQIGKLHLAGTLVQHTPSPFIRRNLAQFNSPYPRRSSLLPNCKQSDPKFDEHLLSPVLPEMNRNILQLNTMNYLDNDKVQLIELLDPVENRFTLKYSDGSYYRITLPILASSSLVEGCLIVLRQCLFKESVLTIFSRWYAKRNALGTENISHEQEWNIFKRFLLEQMGYEGYLDDSDLSKNCQATPSSNPKRKKQSTSGTDDDWANLLNSPYHNKLSDLITNTIHINCNIETESKTKIKSKPTINIDAFLITHVKLIFYCLHLYYEDLKLNNLRSDDLKLLAKLLNQLSCDLGMVDYSLHYWKDFPDICSTENTNVFIEDDLNYISNWTIIDEKPVNVMEFIYNLIRGKNSTSYPYLKNVNKRSRDIIQICGVIAKETAKSDYSIDNLIKPIEIIPWTLSKTEPIVLNYEGNETVAEQATLLMTKRKLTVGDLDTFPIGIYLLFYSALWKCREKPPSNWPAEAYYLLWRDDLAAQAEKIKNDKLEKTAPNEVNSLPVIKETDSTTETIPQIDGMEDLENPLMKLRFPEDVRVGEARKMLRSSEQVPIVLVQRPDVSDHDFIEEQEKHLYAICSRTMALPVGRGMLTLRTSMPVITEPLETPPLCLTGKAPPKGTTVLLNYIDTPTNMNLWPLFHNGVANGLRVMPDASNIDNTWIIFNKPKFNLVNQLEKQMEHAGFLMALGLNGHLRNLEVLSTYDYLIKLHEVTSIGILLGLSAAFRGTSHSGLTKTLSIHVEALLPPTSMELDVPQNLQVAALLGIGLVYQGTAHRHIIEVLLSEIGRPPGPEMENSTDRESYSLAAGLSLGLVTLRQGGCASGLSDLNVPDTLHYYMIGGNRRPLTGSQKDKYKVASFQIREGSSVNLDVTAPGATIALGLMYLGTGNKAVADWMQPPATQYLLDFVRPDFLMFRILARALIMWNDIEPTKEWVENQVPATIRPYCMVKPQPALDVDYEAMNQAYCNIVTGACFALGLRFAGSADEQAFETLLHFCHMFTRLTVKSIAELAGKPTVETCLNVLLLSAAMVMAGTGNLDIMRLVRFLRRRVGVASSTVVTYGSHLALHMALGLLFLGGGRYTLSNSPANIAALICAFYPKFPTHSNDNRYHLQAFRHLYVLAVEPRLVIPKDVHTNKICYAALTIVKLNGTTVKLKGPGIIPDLNILAKVAIDDERYWPVVFERGRNWDLLIKILSSNGYIEVKQRAGCLSYLADKFGFQSSLARTLTESGIIPWDPSPSSIISFSFDQSIKYFCDLFLTTNKEDSESEYESKLKQMLTKITYDAVIHDKLIIVPVFMSLAKMIQNLKFAPNMTNIWQMKLILAQILEMSLSTNLLSQEIALALEQAFETVLDEWQQNLDIPLKSFLNGESLNFNKHILMKLAIYVVYYHLPFKSGYYKGQLFQALCDLNGLYSVKTIRKIVHISNRNV